MPDEFSDKKKVIFSRSMKSENPKLKIISENIEEEVQTIINSQGKDIWLFGGASLVSDMLKANLIDEFIISIHPIILGSGKPLFMDILKRKKLKLLGNQTFSTGLVQLHYKIER